MYSAEALVQIIQTAVGPVILISGQGLLLLTMTNRLGRIIDRSRALSCGMESLGSVPRERVALEIDILWKRGRLIRSAIMLASLSCLFAALLVIVLFLSPLVLLDIPYLISFLFIMSMISLISSLLFFLFDIQSSLSALRIELDGHRDGGDGGAL